MSVDTTATSYPASAYVDPTLTVDATLGDLLSAVKSAGVGHNPRPAVPILAYVHFKLEGRVTVISCFDYSRYGIAEIVSAVKDQGEFLLPYKALLDLLTASGKRATKKISDQWRVVIAVTGNRATITVNGTDYVLHTGPTEEYPELPDLSERGTVPEAIVETAEFMRLMDAAMAAASKDATLPILGAMQLNFEAGTLTILSTDRYRLSMGTMPVVADQDFRALVPVSAWKLIRKQLNKKYPAVIRFNEGDWVTFHSESESGVLSVDGDYPKIRSLFPDTTPHNFAVSADMMAAAVASVAVVIERNTPIRLTFGTDGVLTLDGGSEDQVATDTVPYSTADGLPEEPFRVAFNPKYLSEALKLFKGETVVFSHTTPPKPAVLQAYAQPALRHLIMPVRLPSC